MMVVKTSGGIGSRGRAAVATRSVSGGSKESFPRAGGSNFGNSSQFEKRFSGRVFRTNTFATIAHNSKIDTKVIPSFSISKSGTLERSSFQPAPKAGNNETALRKKFGPRIEAVKGFSSDMHRPSQAALKDTTPLFVRKSEEKRTATFPKHSERNIFQQTQSQRVENPAVSKEATRSITFLKAASPLFVKPEIKPNSSEMNIRVLPRKKTHPLYRTTVEHRATGHTITDAKPITNHSLYERSSHPVIPGREKLIISQAGTIKKAPQRVDAANAWKMLLEKRQSHPTKIATRKTELHKKTVPITQQDRIETPQKSLDTLLKATEPLGIKEVRTVDRKIQAQLKTFVTEAKPQAKHVVATRQAMHRPVTQQERQRVLASYVEQYVPQLQPVRDHEGIINYQLRTVATAKAIADPRINADIEQAARVMAAYQAIIETQSTTVTNSQAERSVLKALDRSLDRNRLKAVLVMPQDVAAENPSSRRQLIAQAEEQIQTEPELVAQPVPRSLIQNEQGSQEATQTTSAVLAVKTEQDSHTFQAVTMQPPQQMMSTPQTDTLEDELDNAQRLEYQRYVELELLFERDDIKDIMRMSVAVYAAMMMRASGDTEVMSGYEIAKTLVDFYQPLTSSIVPEGLPDDYLTTIIEKLSLMEFTQVREVSRTMSRLVQEYPAIMVGEASNIPTEEAIRIRFSKKYPQIAYVD